MSSVLSSQIESGKSVRRPGTSVEEAHVGIATLPAMIMLRGGLELGAFEQTVERDHQPLFKRSAFGPDRLNERGCGCLQRLFELFCLCFEVLDSAALSASLQQITPPLRSPYLSVQIPTVVCRQSILRQEHLDADFNSTLENIEALDEPAITCFQEGNGLRMVCRNRSKTAGKDCRKAGERMINDRMMRENISSAEALQVIRHIAHAGEDFPDADGGNHRAFHPRRNNLICKLSGMLPTCWPAYPNAARCGRLARGKRPGQLTHTKTIASRRRASAVRSGSISGAASAIVMWKSCC